MASRGPRRTCVGCRRVAENAALVRVVRHCDGTLGVGRTLRGRGAWLCAGSSSCLAAAIRRDAFKRAFRAPVDRGAAEAIAEQVVAGNR